MFVQPNPVNMELKGWSIGRDGRYTRFKMKELPHGPSGIGESLN